jgi:hypothetical protein
MAIKETFKIFHFDKTFKNYVYSDRNRPLKPLRESAESTTQRFPNVVEVIFKWTSWYKLVFDTCRRFQSNNFLPTINE